MINWTSFSLSLTSLSLSFLSLSLSSLLGHSQEQTTTWFTSFLIWYTQKKRTYSISLPGNAILLRLNILLRLRILLRLCNQCTKSVSLKKVHFSLKRRLFLSYSFPLFLPFFLLMSWIQERRKRKSTITVSEVLGRTIKGKKRERSRKKEEIEKKERDREKGLKSQLTSAGKAIPEIRCSEPRESVRPKWRWIDSKE